MDSDPPPRSAVIQRLVEAGVPDPYLEEFPQGLLALVKENRIMLPAVVFAVLPTDAQVSSIPILPGEDSENVLDGTNEMSSLINESLQLVRWLMFGGKPEESLRGLEQSAAGRLSACGAVWGNNELAYRCRTCEHDPTCAICVPCFLAGDHKGHDYSTIYTGGGCCDCGDATAWKQEGFCSKHRGGEHMEPLPDELARSVRPVLDVLFTHWREKLKSVSVWTHPRDGVPSDVSAMFADGLSYVIADMLIDFCNRSGSLLSFICRRMLHCQSLLEFLIEAEMFLHARVVKKVQEMLLKFLCDPLFKYEFAKAFITYYATITSKAISDNGFPLEEYPLLSIFSVQIFTVPALTSRLIRETDLLGVLFGCLQDLFVSCVGEDGNLQESKLINLSEITIRLVEDIRHVMSHDEVSKYVIAERSDILRSWMRLLRRVQGMDAQNRVTGIHVEEENETVHAPFIICHCLGNINNLLADCAVSFCEHNVTDNLSKETFKPHHSKIAKNSVESSVCNPGGTSASTCLSNYDDVNFCRRNLFDYPPYAIWLISQCLEAIENWFVPDASPSDSTFPCDAKGRNLGERDICSMDVNASTDMRVAHVCTTEADESPMEIDSDETAGALNILSSAYWSKIAYDVSSQGISFHIPLHRFLSLLLRKVMLWSCGNIDSMERGRRAFQHDFFSKVLVGRHPYGFASFMMEHPLRLRVFCSQVRAGMWRRNGDAATLSSEYYHTVRWFEQGPESDLFLLQCCASLAPPDHFVERIQERYGLTNYVSLGLTQVNEYEPVLVQDMLVLIIQIVKERRFCGFSAVDNLRKELIHKLASGDATHSQLLKALPRDLSKNDMLQNILDMISEYSNPTGMKQGRYSLLKECWTELDLYHPRWNLRDLQVAEERYFQFRKVPVQVDQLPRWMDVFYPFVTLSRIATSMAVCRIVRSVLFYALSAGTSYFSRAPDGVLVTALHLLSLALDICEKNPVSKPEISRPAESCRFEGCSNMDSTLNIELHPLLTNFCKEFDVDPVDPLYLLKHQSVLFLLVSLMKKFKKDDNHYSEKRQFGISTLIENLLKKIVELSPDCMYQLKELPTDIIGHILPHASSNSGGKCEPASDSEVRKAKLERQAAVMEKMRAQQSKFLASLKGTSNDDSLVSKIYENIPSQESDHDVEDPKPLCSLCRGTDLESPLCYYVLLQKSRLMTFVERGTPSWDNLATETLAEAKEGPSDTNVNRPVGSLQLDRTYVVPPEDDIFHYLFKEKLPDVSSAHSSEDSCGRHADCAESLDMMEAFIYHSILLDMENLEFHVSFMDSRNCFTFHDLHGSQTKRKNLEPSLLTESVPSSSQEKLKLHLSPLFRLLQSSSTAMRPTKSHNSEQKGYDGIYISSCGHAAHQGCHERYLSSLKQRHTRRLGFEGLQIVDPDLGEFLCPVCRRFSNSILPVLPGVSNEVWRKRTPLGIGRTLAPTSGKSCLVDENICISQALSFIRCSSRVIGQGKYLKILSGKQNEDLHPVLVSIMKKLFVLCYPAISGTLIPSNRLSGPLVLWDMLRYSIISTEIAARRWLKTGSRGSNKSFKSLFRDLFSSNGFILLLLLRTCQTTRSTNSQELLMRIRAIRLLDGSLCSGVLGDNSFLTGDGREGTMISSIGCFDRDDTFPDVQLWKRMSDPILAHDPFSSLMWALFCLPFPFLTSSELLVSLMQLFYVVCLIQAMITCYSKPDLDMSCFSDCPLNDVCKTMSGSEDVRCYFISNYIDESCHPKTVIRRLTFPYLRRCALLWNLIESTKFSPFHDNAEEREPSSIWFNSDTSNSNNCLADELSCIIELENMFHIPSLETFLKDKAVHTLTLKWCVHFCEGLNVRKPGEQLFSTPAIPFRLMQLPHVYQDLLQRYVKLECSNCKSIPDGPALCLLCGKLCSPIQKVCCSAMACSNHAAVCGASIGVFLLIRRTTILLQRSSRLAFWPSLYLDAFGEEDPDMVRGRPLYLSEERYVALTNLVALHGLDQSSEVLRRTLINPYG